MNSHDSPETIQHDEPAQQSIHKTSQPNKKNIENANHKGVGGIMLLIAILVSGLVGLVMRFWAVPYLLRLTEDFSYQTDVLSLDNFYNESEQQFVGAQRSITSFGYSAADVDASVANIRNFFDVRSVSGETIVKISRDYEIDTKDWSHVNKSGNQLREGYLFAPRHISSGHTFTYWHVNYDTPIELVFDEAQIIDGLEVYKYSSVFGVDQTAELTHLPGVPKERGVNLDVSISIWFEPMSGWLVKYEDSAIAYYYDQSSGARIHPWNKFSNRFRRSSIVDQTEHARDLRMKILFLEVGLPLLILGVASAIIAWRSRRIAVIIVSGSLIVVVVVGGILSVMYSGSEPEQILVGVSKWVQDGNEQYDLNIRGFKDALEQAGYIEGENVRYIEASAQADVTRQKQIAGDFLEQNVDLVYSLTTPGTQIIKETISNRPVIFSIVTYPQQAGLISSLQNSGNNLVGTRNWVPAPTQLQVFRNIVPSIRKIAFLHRTDEINSEIQLTEMSGAAEEVGIELVSVHAGARLELIELLSKHVDIDGIYSSCDTLVQSEAESDIISFARLHSIPSFSCNISGPYKGDLVGIVADFYKIGKLAGEKAILVLEGVPPTALQTNTVTQPTILLNLDTANELNIAVPQGVLSDADEIIQQ